MSESNPGAIISRHQSDREHGTYASYITGFILSVVLTMATYLTVVQHMLSGYALLILILGLAVVQFLVQLFFFLHLGRETKPRWKLLVLFFMIMVVLILVLGSLWIMYNLNYRMMPMSQQQVNMYMQSQGGGF